MTKPNDPDRVPREPLPPHLAECIATAQDRCKDMRFALQAYSGLEKLLTLAQRSEHKQTAADRASVAALLRLITEEARHRLEAAIGAVDEVGEEVAIHRERG